MNNETGNRNTGNRNTGDRNTGDGNTTNYSSGFFNSKEPKVISFNIQTRFTRQQFIDKFPEYFDLACDLLENKKIGFEKYLNT